MKTLINTLSVLALLFLLVLNAHPYGCSYVSNKLGVSDSLYLTLQGTEAQEVHSKLLLTGMKCFNPVNDYKPSSLESALSFLPVIKKDIQDSSNPNNVLFPNTCEFIVKNNNEKITITKVVVRCEGHFKTFYKSWSGKPTPPNDYLIYTIHINYQEKLNARNLSLTNCIIVDLDYE